MKVPRWAEQFVSRLSRRLGYNIVPVWRENRFDTARYLTRLFDLLAVDCVIDVGANLGQYRDFLRREVGYRGLIASFEPIPHHLRHLEQRARRDANWVVKPHALGATAGRVQFNVMTHTEFSSFLTPRHDEVTLFGDMNKVRERIDVEVETLDAVISMLREHASAKNIYLKLDTQGFDLEVLKGASNRLYEIKALQFEAAVRQIYVAVPRYDEVIKYCEQRGFIMSGIFPNNDGHFPILVEFDCFMIRQDNEAVRAKVRIPSGNEMRNREE